MTRPFYRTPALPDDIKAYLASVGPTARAAILGTQPTAPAAPVAAQPEYEQLAALQPRPAMGLPSAPAPQQPPGVQYAELAALQAPPPLAYPPVPGQPSPQAAPRPTPQPAAAPAPTVSAPQANVPAPVARASGNAQPAPPSSEEDDGLPGAGSLIPLRISAALGGVADSIAHLGNRAQRSGRGEAALARLDSIQRERRSTLRERAAKAEAAEKEAAAKALQAEMDDPLSARSQQMQSGRMGELAKSVGLDPTQFSAAQLVEFGKSPKDIHTMARQFQSDAAQQVRDQRAAAAEGAKFDADSSLSQRYREHMRSLFTQLRMDPATISDSMPYAEIVDPNGAGQSALGERRAMAAGGLRPGREGVSGAGAINTGTGDISTSADAVAATIKAAFPRDAQPENLDARIRPILGIRDEQERKHAIDQLVKEGERMHGQLKQFTVDAEKWQKMKTSLDAVRQDMAQYKGDLPGAGIEALPTVIAQKLPFVGGEASMLDTAVQSATLSKGGRVQRGKLNMLNEAYKRTQSGAAIGLSEDEKFKVQDGLAAGASDEQVLEAIDVFGGYFDSNWSELQAGNPEGAEMYERNLAGRKPKGNLGELPPGVELVE